MLERRLKIANVSPQTHLLTWIRSDSEGALKQHTGIQNLTHSWAHYGNVVRHTVSALVRNPCTGLTSHTAPSPKPRWLWGPREGPYALCLHATHSRRPHETFCHHTFMSPGWSQRHTERPCRLAACAEISGCICHSGFQGPCTRWTLRISDRYELWAEDTQCLSAVSLIRQSRPRKIPDHAEDGLNIQHLLCVSLWEALSICAK